MVAWKLFQMGKDTSHMPSYPVDIRVSINRRSGLRLESVPIVWNGWTLSSGYLWRCGCLCVYVCPSL